MEFESIEIAENRCKNQDNSVCSFLLNVEFTYVTKCYFAVMNRTKIYGMKCYAETKLL